MTIYLAGQPFCVCLVSCWDLQPESRGVFLKGVEKMQAFPVVLLFSGCELPVLPGGLALGSHPPPVLCLILLNTGPSKAPQAAGWDGGGVPTLAVCTPSLGD